MIDLNATVFKVTSDGIVRQAIAVSFVGGKIVADVFRPQHRSTVDEFHTAFLVQHVEVPYKVVVVGTADAYRDVLGNSVVKAWERYKDRVIATFDASHLPTVAGAFTAKGQGNLFDPANMMQPIRRVEAKEVRGTCSVAELLTRIGGLM